MERFEARELWLPRFDRAVLLGGKGTGKECALAVRWLGIGQPAVQRSVVRGGKNCARVEFGAFPLTKH